MKKKFLFLILTLLAFVASSPHASAYYISYYPDENGNWSLNNNMGSNHTFVLNVTTADNTDYYLLLHNAQGSSKDNIAKSSNNVWHNGGYDQIFALSEGENTLYQYGNMNGGQLKLSSAKVGKYTLTFNPSGSEGKLNVAYEASSTPSTLTQMYVMGDSYGWEASGAKMTTNTSAKTATYTTTSDIAANTRWKVASVDYGIDIKRKSDYIFKYADGSAYDGIINENNNAITVSKALPSGTVITYSYDSKKATVTVPKASTPVTVSKVEMINRGQTITNGSFKLVDGKWTLTNFTPYEWAYNGHWNAMHRIKVTLSNGTSKEYTIDSNNENYEIWQTTHNLVEATGGYFMFKKENGARTITLTFNGTTLSSMTLSDEAPTIPDWVNMPLKPSDFAGGKAHYFLVGFRTAGWRLQPEWELTKTAENTYALPANQRLMYNQYFGIAKVDTYDDYIHQRYTMFYNAGYVVKSDNNNVTINLNASRTNPVTAAVNNKLNSMLWSRTLNVGTPNTADMDESTIRWSYPSVLKKFQITVTNGNPTTLTIESTQTPAEVVKHRAFTLVGAEIKSNIEYDINGTKKTIGQATYNAAELNMTGWQNPWVQYDADGNPYIDGNGNAVYHTAFDADYLTGHPSKFDYKLGDNSTFSYNSNRITFVEVSKFTDEQLAKDEYADLYKMFAGKTHDFTDNGTHSNGNFQYTEVWNKPGSGWAKDGNGNNVTTNSSYTHNDWKCFVVKDMWVKGKFKIWSGWGGNIKDSECINADDGHSARWFPANGGHAALKTVKSVEGGHVTGENAKINVYGMRMDVEGADFQIEGSNNDLRYYKRVILWYPGGQCGFNSAVLQLVIDEGGPTIQAQCTDNKSFSYRWNIPQGGTTEDVVDSYTIIRRNIESGSTVTVKKETGLALTPADRVNFTTWIADDKPAQPGEYEYEITIHYKNSNITKSALSNPVHIFAKAQPVLLKAEQYMDENGLYSFDLVLTPTLRENELNRTVNSKTGLDMAKEVRIWSDDEYTKQAMANMRDAALPEGWVKKDDGYYYTLPADKTGLIQPITLCDIAPNAGLDGADDKEYTFKVQLTSDDADWSTLAYVEAPAAASIYAPTVDIHLSQPTIAKIETAMERVDIAKKYADFDDEASFPDGWFIKDRITNERRIENPALYTRFNEVRAAATIDPLKVTQSVKDNWSIGYKVTVNGNSAEPLTGVTPTNVTIHGLPANSTGVSANVAVSYTRNGASYNALVQPGTSQNFNLSSAEPTFTPKEQTWFQRDYAEPNNASPDNNRTLAFAQFDGTVGGFDPNLNYYVDYNFTADGVDAICDQLKALKSTGTDTDFKDQYLYWGVFNGKAASGGRVIGKRPAGAGSTNGSKFVDELQFDYLYYNHADNDAYIKEWTLANSWTDAFIADSHRLPVEVGPIACAAYGDDITLSDVDIKGSVDIIYPILEGIAVTDETPAPASAQQRAGAAEAAASYTPADINLANVKTIKSEVAGETPISIAITNDKKVTGIDEISADAITLDGDAEIYNLQGIRIYKPAPGNTYIVRRGTSVAKVLCK